VLVVVVAVAKFRLEYSLRRRGLHLRISSSLAPCSEHSRRRLAISRWNIQNAVKSKQMRMALISQMCSNSLNLTSAAANSNNNWTISMRELRSHSLLCHAFFGNFYPLPPFLSQSVIPADNFSLFRLVSQHSGQNVSFGRHTFPVGPYCDRPVVDGRTTYVAKPSATGQPTRPTQPFILSKSINE